MFFCSSVSKNVLLSSKTCTYVLLSLKNTHVLSSKTCSSVLLSLKKHTRSVKQNLYLCSSVFKKTYTFCLSKPVLLFFCQKTHTFFCQAKTCFSSLLAVNTILAFNLQFVASEVYQQSVIKAGRSEVVHQLCFMDR